MKKILASDFDLTYYTNLDDLYKNNNAVKKFRDNENVFIIATGRYYSSIKAVIENYNIPFDYLICNDGSIIFDNNFNILYENSIPNTTVTKIIDILKTKDAFVDWFIDTDEGLTKDLNKKTNSIIARYKDYNKAIKVLNDLLQDCNGITGYISTNWINISTKGTNKANAILFVANLINVDLSDIYAIGDGINDIEMIESFNSGIMNNSAEELNVLGKKKFKAVYEFIEKINSD